MDMGSFHVQSNWKEHGAKYLAVAFVEEGIALRNTGIKIPILVMGGVFSQQIKLFLDNDLDITASSIEKLAAIDEAAASMKTKAKVHLKIDTGLERIGTHYYSAEKFLEESLKSKNCEVCGIYSHFVSSMEENPELTKLQLERFMEVVSFYEKHSLQTPLRHIANSGSILAAADANLDLVRPGLLIYGVLPSSNSDSNLQLEPVMSLSSQVAYFKVVKRGAGVSYSHKWMAKEDTRVVTIPLGYGDGYSRQFSNNAEVLINSKRYPVIGNVCMDQLMVSLGKDGTAYNGDPVVLIGKQGSEKITIEELAERIQTTPHEILVSLKSRIPRRYTLADRTWIE